ncbi:MAG: hypothetical protein HKN34_08705 [Gammaproteobacteria bacterium]|nr:hypothetical protein [Gammaproteobacteria bacterium]
MRKLAENELPPEYRAVTEQRNALKKKIDLTSSDTEKKELIRGWKQLTHRLMESEASIMKKFKAKQRKLHNEMLIGFGLTLILIAWVISSWYLSS